MPTDLLGAAGNAIGTAGSALNNVLDAQRWALAKGLTGHNDPDKQLEAERGAIGLGDTYKKMPLWARGTLDFGLKTATDPLTYESLGSGPLLRGGKAGLEAMSSLGKAGLERSPQFVQNAANEAGEVGKAASDWWTRIKAPGGAGVGQLEIEQGRPARDLLLGATSKGGAEEAEFTKRLQAGHTAATQGLTAEQETPVRQALKGDFPADWLTDEQKTGYDALRVNSDTARYANANRGLRARIALRHGGLGERAAGKTLPAQEGPAGSATGLWRPMQPQTTLTRVPKRTLRSQAPIKPFAVAPNLREFTGEPGKDSLAQFRAQYHTAPHTEKLTAPEEAERFEYNPLTWKNPNLKPQPDVKITQAALPEFREAWDRMLANAAREKGRTGIKNELEAGGLDLQDKAVQEALVKRGGPVNLLEKAIKGVQGYGKAGTVGFTPTHAGNIGALDVLHASPGAAARAIPLAAKVLRHPDQAYDLLKPGRELGADMTTGPEGFFGNWPLLARMAAGGATGGVAGYNLGADKDTPFRDRVERMGLGALAGAGAGAAAPAWTKAMSHGVFTYDKAAKQELAQEYARKGIGGTHQYGAGRQATEDLIDYANKSEIGRGMSWLSMFPTYESQLPGAVLRGIARNPAKAAALSRVTGGLYGGGSVDTPAGTAQSFLSVPKIGRDMGDPKRYIRSSMSGPTRIAASMLQKFGVLPQTRQPYYATYGQDPTSLRVILSALLAGDPQAQTILNEAGLGTHPGTAAQDALFQFTGLGVRK